jgi:hypothetical protein
MKRNDVKALTEAVDELSESYVDLAQVLKETTSAAKAVKPLWRSKNNSLLMKVGLALIAFPDPTISDVVGGLLVAAGIVQKGIQHRTIYVEDVYKTFQDAFRDIRNVKNEI